MNRTKVLFLSILATSVLSLGCATDTLLDGVPEDGLAENTEALHSLPYCVPALPQNMSSLPIEISKIRWKGTISVGSDAFIQEVKGGRLRTLGTFPISNVTGVCGSGQITFKIPNIGDNNVWVRLTVAGLKWKTEVLWEGKIYVTSN